MTRFQVILSPERNPDAHEILSPPPRRFWQLKAGLAALLMASAVIGLVLAALFLGSIIAALLVFLVVMVSAARNRGGHSACRQRPQQTESVGRQGMLKDLFAP